VACIRVSVIAIRCRCCVVALDFLSHYSVSVGACPRRTKPPKRERPHLPGPCKVPQTNGKLTNARYIEHHQYDEDHEDYP
jgi:hypothetical protein